MNQYLCLAGALLVAVGAATAQPTEPTRATKIKTKSKTGRQASAPATGAGSTPTDWSLPYAASITAEGWVLLNK